MQGDNSFTGSIQERREKEKRVKKKIADILLNVREEKQHIQNQLAINDLKIKQYCEEYEELRYQHDFTQLSEKETLILSSIIDGLIESNINPSTVLGQQASEVIKQRVQQRKEENPLHQEAYEKLERGDVLRIQNEIISSLMGQIERNEKLTQQKKKAQSSKS